MSRGLHGLRPWLIQRVSAVYMALFTLFVTGRLLVAPMTVAAWRQWLATPGVALAFALFFVALLLHAWVGMRDVLLDYAHPLWLRLGLFSLLAVFLLGNGFWLFYLLLANLLERSA